MCNLKELYFAFKQKYREIKIGFSKFYCQRLKWCVLAGSPGTHAVCVCVIYQNVYLLASTLNLHHKEAILKQFISSWIQLFVAEIIELVF